MPQLFLDCDGVLADFDAYAAEHFKLPPREVEREKSPDFWDELKTHKDLFLNFSLKSDARKLFEAVEHLKPIILTGCPEGGWAEPQKLAWAAKHFPGTEMITCRSKDKRKHMKKGGDVLVDDWPKYRSRWEEAGGVFILHENAEDTIRQLQAINLLAPPGAGRK